MSENGLLEAKIMFRVDKDLHRWFKWHALKHDTTMSAILKAYLEDLRRKEKSDNQDAKQEG